MRKVFGIAGALLAFESAPRRAEACSCGVGPVALSPADAMTAVPLNAVMIARSDDGAMPTLELRDAATQQIVPLTVEVRRPSSSSSGLTIFAKPASLAPNTEYVLVAHEESWPDQHSTFTTGDAVDTTPPDFSGLRAFSLETMTWPVIHPDGSGCAGGCMAVRDGHLSRLHLDYGVPADAVHIALQIRRADDVTYDEVPLLGGAQLLDGDICAPLPPSLDPGREYCARVVTYDIAGNIAGGDTEVCTAALTCTPRLEPAGSCQPADDCVPMTAEPESSGCSTTRAPAWVGLLAFAALVPRRRRR